LKVRLYPDYRSAVYNGQTSRPASAGSSGFRGLDFQDTHLIPSIASIRGTDTGYLAFHAPRYQFLLKLVDAHLPPRGEVLDIGLSPFTRLLREHIGGPVDTLGLEPTSGIPDGTHYEFDLNALGDGSQARPPLHDYDVIVFAEVLEHLHTSPLTVLGFLHQSLARDGVLILQTPNAASLFKRIRLLFGVQPYEMIRENRRNPGHFREYTVGELRTLAQQTGFEPLAIARRYYFDARFADIDETGRGGRSRPVIGSLKNVVYAALPAFLREGVTIVLRKTASDSPIHQFPDSSTRQLP
jgi:hypothetical protein